MVAEREYPEPTVLRNHIDQTINGIDNHFNFAHERLEHLKNVLLRELETIFNKFRDQISGGHRGYQSNPQLCRRPLYILWGFGFCFQTAFILCSAFPITAN